MANFRKKCVFLAVLLAVAPALPTAAYYREPPTEKPFIIKTKVKYWFSTASSQVRASQLTPAYWWIPPDGNIAMGRTDDFKRMDTSFPLFSAELQPASGFSLEFETGDSRYNGGHFMQHEWLDAKNRIITFYYDGTIWDSPDHRDYAASKARIDGRARQYSGNLYLRVYKSRLNHLDDDFDLNHTVDLFVGYSWYENRMHLANGYKSLSTQFFLPTPPAGPLSGLDSTSRTRWYGWRAGFRDQIRLAENFSAEGKASFGPRLRFTGEDYWNLETSLADPGLKRSAYGMGLELSGSASWRFWKQFQLEGGYLVWKYSASSGRETYYYADGTSWQGKLNKILSSRKGFFLALSWKF